jgi:hypothetical protein
MYARDDSRLGEINLVDAQWTSPALSRNSSCKPRRASRELLQESTSARAGSRKAGPQHSGMPVASVLLFCAKQVRPMGRPSRQT